MKYKREHLEQLADNVFNNLQDPSVQSGILFLSMITQNTPEECLAKIKQIKEGTFNYEI